MPELPEVETICRGIAPYLIGHVIQDVIVRDSRLRWPVLSTLRDILAGQRIQNVSRRAKYLLIHLHKGTLLIHLGMSGSLRLSPLSTAAEKHDHIDFIIDPGCLRYRDPRRFGAVLWHSDPIEHHPLLAHLGPEPLDDTFNGNILYQLGSRRNTRIKQFIMDSHVVAGIGNIYANEALFYAAIHPERRTSCMTAQDYSRLATTLQSVLQRAIEAGGSTLKDFVDARGKPGYFQQSYQVYDRAKLPCYRCATPIEKIRQGQRSSYYCPSCQPW